MSVFEHSGSPTFCHWAAIFSNSKMLFNCSAVFNALQSTFPVWHYSIHRRFESHMVFDDITIVGVSTMLYKISAPNEGLEPSTLRLKVWCSTDWANRALTNLGVKRYSIFCLHVMTTPHQNIGKVWFRTPGPLHKSHTWWELNSVISIRKMYLKGVLIWLELYCH